MYSFKFNLNQEFKLNGENVHWTLLHYASALGRVEIVKFLLENNADPTITDSTGKNAKKIAQVLGQIEIEKIL
jgi:ankyrin repeat protein